MHLLPADPEVRAAILALRADSDPWIGEAAAAAEKALQTIPSGPKKQRG